MFPGSHHHLSSRVVSHPSLCPISPHRHLWTYLCLFIREHLYIYKTVTHISHVHQHEGGLCWPSCRGAHAHPTQGLLLRLAGRGHILHPPLAAEDLGVRLAGMAVARSWANMWHPSGDPPACRLAYGNPMGSWHGVLWRAPRGASVWVPCREACCVSSHTGGHGTPHSWVLAPTGNMLTCGCILWGSCWTMHTQSQGCWCPGPYPAPPMCGALKAARMMAPPASMALGTAQHGHVPSVGTRDGDQTSRARGCLAQPQPSPEVPNSCPGVPLCQVCVLRGALPARPPS